MTKVNRIKDVLNEKKHTGKWLDENVKKDMATVSRWCNNLTQPSSVTLNQIAILLNVDRRELLNKSK